MPTFLFINGKYLNEFKKEMEIKEDNKMTKNFKEVIADIKEGEVWESHCKEIRLFKNGTIEILAKGTHTFGASVQLNDRYKYTLQRQKVSFTEAFKAYEEGKEIESCVSENKWGEEVACFNTIAINDIKGQWYINN